jgi:hypothetical protein
VEKSETTILYKYEQMQEMCEYVNFRTKAGKENSCHITQTNYNNHCHYRMNEWSWVPDHRLFNDVLSTAEVI